MLACLKSWEKLIAKSGGGKPHETGSTKSQIFILEHWETGGLGKDGETSLD